MHESLPKGELEELLGGIEDRDVPTATIGTLPKLPQNAEHPYHLVVVAGQECPSLSGLPMALGAGFKLIDKDREKTKDKDKDNQASESLKSGKQESEKERDREDEPPRKTRHLSLRHHSHQRVSQEEDTPPNTSSSAHDVHHTAYGWTSMLEDWYTNGGFASTPTPPGGQDEGRESPCPEEDDISLSPKAKSTGDLNARMNAIRKGPYELLIKERMMGLYLAVFIKRDIKDLVRGMSKSAVTAGLIGGRVGNKGGVGISLNIDGTTLLFLNAHLAAQQTELAVDTFLAPDDPRVMAEDITDRFDFTFLCGDLNFRLDITRLHADWLISRRDYAQALAFDQLRKVMQSGEAFVDFNEAPIDFPPTFKYDVLRSKRSKHRSFKRYSKNPALDMIQHEKLLTEIEERRQDADEERSDEDVEIDVEAASVASTAFTSQSRYTTDGDDPEVEREDYFLSSTSPRTNASTGNLVNKVSVRSCGS
ncbi:hypothetical protein EW026_g2394 [Hermanssonia centrifuga]|uniref:Inositol polyphosphate-related phosphatase domain-containing protein n=1 Tax=Hermanssonia centrifuga TaxID=98765 RepID=A0A4S4KQG5_9APHY|nr:hypothetical protein EW026_g2394 [Hermanssonia centrifuga]